MPPESQADPLADALGVLSRAYLRKWGQADTLWREKQRAQAAGLVVEGGA